MVCRKEAAVDGGGEVAVLTSNPQTAAKKTPPSHNAQHEAFYGSLNGCIFLVRSRSLAGNARVSSCVPEKDVLVSGLLESLLTTSQDSPAIVEGNVSASASCPPDTVDF